MNLVIDFETLATTPDAVVLSLGAVLNYTDRNGERVTLEREWFFNHDTRLLRKIDEGTVAWWNKQSPEARAMFDGLQEKGIGFEQFFHEFEDFLKTPPHSLSGLKVWGNGSLFDTAILNNIYQENHRKPLWKYSNEMCYRTINKFFAIDKGQAFEGTRHSALADAHFQMKCLLQWLDNR